jgi:F420-0:gamma-glutamyl ligase
LGPESNVIVFPIRSNLAKPGDSVPELFSDGLARNRVRLKTRDVVAVSSKIVGIAEERIRYLESVKPGSKAKSLARKYSLTAAFAQAVLDQKNAPEGAVVLWPLNADLSAKNIRRSIRRKSGKNVGVVIVDSRVGPLRLGTTGFAIGCAGFESIEDIRGRVDLFGRRIEITVRAIADGIAAAAQLVMGEAADRVPFAIVRDAPATFGSERGIRSTKLAWNQCLYMSQIPRADG